MRLVTCLATATGEAALHGGPDGHDGPECGAVATSAIVDEEDAEEKREDGHEDEQKHEDVGDLRAGAHERGKGLVHAAPVLEQPEEAEEAQQLQIGRVALQPQVEQLDGDRRREVDPEPALEVLPRDERPRTALSLYRARARLSPRSQPAPLPDVSSGRGPAD